MKWTVPARSRHRLAAAATGSGRSATTRAPAHPPALSPTRRPLHEGEARGAESLEQVDGGFRQQLARAAGGFFSHVHGGRAARARRFVRGVRHADGGGGAAPRREAAEATFQISLGGGATDTRRIVQGVDHGVVGAAPGETGQGPLWRRFGGGVLVGSGGLRVALIGNLAPRRAAGHAGPLAGGQRSGGGGGLVPLRPVFGGREPGGTPDQAVHSPVLHVRVQVHVVRVGWRGGGRRAAGRWRHVPVLVVVLHGRVLYQIREGTGQVSCDASREASQ
mmetsp:Transcript_8595/g.17621  ORF Transcript_8595/g.17621 Transcript_8595/m.17621 type:complete len:277 (+) Transcript_8595:1189-2019(+)